MNLNDDKDLEVPNFTTASRVLEEPGITVSMIMLEALGWAHWPEVCMAKPVRCLFSYGCQRNVCIHRYDVNPNRNTLARHR